MEVVVGGGVGGGQRARLEVELEVECARVEVVVGGEVGGGVCASGDGRTLKEGKSLRSVLWPINKRVEVCIFRAVNVLRTGTVLA